MDSYDGDADFEGKLQEKLNNEYNERVRFCDMKNSQLQSTAENMRLSILGRDSKGKDEKPLGVVDAYVNNCIVCITKNPELSFPVTGLSYVKNMQILLGWIV